MDGNVATWGEWALNALALMENNDEVGIVGNSSSRRLMEGVDGAANAMSLPEGRAAGRRLTDIDFELDFNGPMVTFSIALTRFDVSFYFEKDGNQLIIGATGSGCAYEVLCVNGEIEA